MVKANSGGITLDGEDGSRFGGAGGNEGSRGGGSMGGVGGDGGMTLLLTPGTTSMASMKRRAQDALPG